MSIGPVAVLLGNTPRMWISELIFVWFVGDYVVWGIVQLPRYLGVGSQELDLC